MMETIDKLPEDYALYHCGNGKTYAAHKKSCVFCKHCDIIYDFTNGPYMFSCSGINSTTEVIELYQKAAFELGGCYAWEEVTSND